MKEELITTIMYVLAPFTIIFFVVLIYKRIITPAEINKEKIKKVIDLEMLFVNDCEISFQLNEPSHAKERIDLIVIRIDYTKKKICIDVLQGIESIKSLALKPSLTQDFTKYEYELRPVKICIDGSMEVLNKVIYTGGDF